MPMARFSAVWGLLLLLLAAMAHGVSYQATPQSYDKLLRQLQPGDRLELQPGEYRSGLPLYNLNGRPGAPIVISGPESGKAVILGNDGANTVGIYDSSYLVIRRLTLDGRNKPVDAVKGEGHGHFAHHITLEQLEIVNHGADQSIVGISTKCPAWNWVVRNNRIVGAGTGMYFGNSDGTAPFIAGLIENNVVTGSLGYDLQIKHQKPRPLLDGMPSAPGRTIIRYNRFSKDDNSSAGPQARPNLLLGHWPLSGVGSEDRYEVYGNILANNPGEALLQAEGNVAIYNNLFYNLHGDALNIQPHNDIPRNVDIFHNTIVASGSGIRLLSGGHALFWPQRIAANAVFANAPIRGGMQRDNLQRTPQEAGLYLQRPFDVSGALRLDPVPGKLALRGAGEWWMAQYTDATGDFSRRPALGSYVGAYAAPGGAVLELGASASGAGTRRDLLLQSVLAGLAALLLGVLQRPGATGAGQVLRLAPYPLLLATLLLVSGWQGYLQPLLLLAAIVVGAVAARWLAVHRAAAAGLRLDFAGGCIWLLLLAYYWLPLGLPPNRAALLALLARAHDAGWGVNPAATIAIAYAWAVPAALAGRSGQWARQRLYAYVLALPWLAAAGQLLTGGDAFGWGLPLAGAAGGLLGLSAGSLIMRSRAAGMLIGAISALWVLLSGWIDLSALLGGYCYPLADLLAGAALPVLVCGLLLGRLLPARPGSTAALMLLLAGATLAGTRWQALHAGSGGDYLLLLCCGWLGIRLGASRNDAAQSAGDAAAQPWRLMLVGWAMLGMLLLLAGYFGRMPYDAHLLLQPLAPLRSAVVWGILAFAICAMPVLLLDWCNRQRQRAAALLGAMLAQLLASVLLLWLALPAPRFGHSAIACLMLITGLVWLGVALAGRSRLGWYRDPVWLALGLGCGMLPLGALVLATHGTAPQTLLLMLVAVTAASLAAIYACRRIAADRRWLGQGLLLAGAALAGGALALRLGLGGWQEWQSWLVALLRTLLSPYFQHYAEGRALGLRFALLGLGWQLLLFIWQWPAWSMVVAQHEQRLQAHKQRLANRQAAARGAPA